MHLLQLLIDHDNVPFQEVGLRHIFDAWLDSLDGLLRPASGVVLRVRAYGGWFAGVASTDARFSAGELYQETCPSVFLRQQRVIRVTFEFADYLAGYSPQDSSDHVIRITHTVAARGKSILASLRPRKSVSCVEAGCRLRETVHWLKSRQACASPHCPYKFSDFFTRLEQKQVDVHLGVDALLLASRLGPTDYLGVVSDDLDLVPAVVAATLQTGRQDAVFLLRFASGSRNLDDVLVNCGAGIVDVAPTALPGK